MRRPIIATLALTATIGLSACGGAHPQEVKNKTTSPSPATTAAGEDVPASKPAPQAEDANKPNTPACNLLSSSDLGQVAGAPIATYGTNDVPSQHFSECQTFAKVRTHNVVVDITCPPYAQMRAEGFQTTTTPIPNSAPNAAWGDTGHTVGFVPTPDGCLVEVIRSIFYKDNIEANMAAALKSAYDNEVKLGKAPI